MLKFKDFKRELELQEELKVIKMNLPKETSTFILTWNDNFSKNHDLYSRIQRTGLSRKDAIKTIINGIEVASEKLKQNDGMYILDFSLSKFLLTVFMEKDKKHLNIKTILDYDMKTRASDKRLSVNEAETLFEVDLSEFYSDGLVNGMFGSFYIEENVKRTELDIFVDNIIVVEL